MNNSQFKEFVWEEMPWIDVEVAKSNTSLSARPLPATLLFARSFIDQGQEENAKDISETEWFSFLYKIIREWYEDRYGSALEQNPGGYTTGFVVIYNMPFLMRIPLTVRKLETPGETIWLIFPNEVLPEEDPLSWIVSPPNLAGLKNEDLQKLREDATFVASSLRSSHINLMCADKNDPVTEGLIALSHRHLEKVAEDIARGKNNDICSASCEMMMAIEKVLKAFIHQKSGSHPESHQLTGLANTASHKYGLKIDRELLKSLPSPNEYNKLRFGENTGRNLATEELNYHNTLRTIDGVSKQFDQKYQFNNFALLLKRPPWLGDSAN